MNSWRASPPWRDARPVTSSWSANWDWAAGVSAGFSSSNWPASPSVASSSSSIASIGAFPMPPPARDRAPVQIRPAISLPAALICIATATASFDLIADPARRGQRKLKIFSSRPMRSATPCRATRSWSTSIRLKPTAACQAVSFGFWSAATPPSSARFITPIPVAVTGKTLSFPSTSA